MDTREKTYRKAFVPNALVYKVAQVKISKDDRILDIGCGVDEYHPKRLRSHGYTCDGIDLSRPDLTARGKYDVILLSNVLNVQTNIKDLEDTLNLAHAVRQCGYYNHMELSQYATQDGHNR